mgnify:CR=1 FL=1
MEDIARFFWYITPDQIESREIEIPNAFKPDEVRIGSRDFVDFDITNGRLKHRWVPTTRAGAIRFLLYHEDAAGLRAAAENYFIAQIHIDEPIKNKIETYPKLVPSGHRGAIISVPFTQTLMKGSMRDPAPKFSYNPRKLVNVSSEKDIFAINMEIMSPQEILDMSEVEVKYFESLKESGRKKPRPVQHGPMDIRMGSVGLEDECPICNTVAPGSKRTNEVSCPGHFGHIDLAEPVPNILFLGEKAKQAKGNYPIMETLKNTCLHCKRIMIPQEAMDFYRAKIMSEFELGGRNHKSRARIRGIMGPEFAKITDRICPHCEKQSPDVYFSYRSYKFGLTSQLEGDDELTFSKVVSIFEEIPDEDLYFVGVNPETSRPENMFFRYLPVIPNNARPLAQRSDGKMELDDLTQLYADVVYASERIHEMRVGQQSLDREGYWHGQLFVAVSRVIDNQNTTIGSGGSKTKYDYDGTASTVSFDGLLNRLDGKEGRFRDNLQSKYVDSVGYSTVSPDPNLSIDEIGVPIKVCKTISYPRVVTEENIEEIKGYMRNNMDNKYPAARYIFPDRFARMEESIKLAPTSGGKTGWEYHIRHVERRMEDLEVGMAVSIDLMEGDICLFNRAPSLHRQSIMAFRVRPVEGKTLSFNPTVCIPFNADYDGDAMKAHFVQSEEAKAEAEKLMMLTKNLIHARYGKLTVATDQDQTSGLYLLTYTDKSRRNTWDEGAQLGYNDEGIPYLSKSSACSCYSTVFSEIRGGKEREYRTVTSLPEPDEKTPSGAPGYTGRALFSHLFDVLDATYVSAWFSGRTPLTKVLEDGSVVVDYDENGKKQYEEVLLKDGKLITGTLEKAAFGEGGASIAPSFIYHEGYEAGQAKLVEFIEMATRLGFAAHRVIGYTMGVDDVSEPGVQPEIDGLYRKCLNDIYKIDRAFANGQLKQYVQTHTPEKMVSALADPLSYIEEEVLGFTNEFENALLKPIENEQGSGNPMQIAVRSKARGKDINIRQMTGAFGQARLGTKRVTYGIEGDRVLPHYPKGSLDPRHRGLIRGSYASGMEPDEYFITSIAGRRAVVESSQGNIAKSGYLERKMIKALESCVVNKRRQVVNLRTGRVISPLVGDDGLAPYHIRGDDDNVNEHGLTITLQPLFFDFECTHGITLAEKCEKCQKSSDLSTFIAKIDKVVAENTRKAVESKLAVREMSKPNVKKLATRLNEYFEDSLCRIGEAIGATAGACIGEPATQAALRTFHFAGAMQSQGSVGRLAQILQYTEDSNDTPETTLWLKEEVPSDQAQLILSLLAQVKGDQIIKLISYDIENSLILVKFDFNAMGVYNISPDIILRQMNDALNAAAAAKILRYEMLSDRISPEKPFVIRLESVESSPSPLLYAKETLMNCDYNGISGVRNIELLQPGTDGRYGIRMLSANKDMLNRVVKLFGNKLDELETNNHHWVAQKYGLEAALANIYKELDFQMNLTAQGIGEYDNRYIRTIVDCMGEYGIVKSLGPAGMSGYDNPSILGGMSIQYVKDILNGGATMGNKDPISGVTESVVVGKLPKIGDYAPE